jgi:beta-galactosidase
VITILSQLEPPWESPETTSIGRLAMHIVPHADRLDLDGRWRFQLLAAPTAVPGPDWGEADVPGCWTMQGLGDLLRYTNVQMPFLELPPHPPTENRPR